jgi:hypothetical protein
VAAQLFTDTTPATRYALDALSARLGTCMPTVDQLGDYESLIDIGPLTVAIRRPAGAGIAASLNREATNGTRKVQAAVEARIAEIGSALPKAAHPTITLVEIAHPDTYQGAQRGDDPIFAVRHGLLRTGRLSQFVTPVVEPKRPPRVREGREPSDANRERFTAAVDDLFRQLGVRPEPLPQPAASTIERQPALLAVWLIRQNKGRIWGVGRQVPIAILIDPTGQHIQIRAPQVDWQPLHTGLIKVGERYVGIDLRCGPDDVLRFVKETIGEVVGVYPDTLLLTHAQNLRAGWAGLSNSHLELDMLSFGAGDPQHIANPGLRHVRVRTSVGNETPECFGVTDSNSGQPQGLWRFISTRVFGSTGAKPSTAVSALGGVSKIVPNEHNDKVLAPKPNQQVWNQQFIELLVAAIQDGDRPEQWAALAHELRRVAPYVKVTTIMPWPLHLAEQVEEYLLPIKINTILDEDPADEE